MLQPLSQDELALLFQRALDEMQLDIAVQDEAKQHILAYADGDARRLLNFCESLLMVAQQAGVAEIDMDFLQSTMASKMRLFDKGGDAFYDQISALHKSVRGSNPDAALYWMQRMLDGGADPLYVGRRLVRMAIEDIGLADPRCLEICLNACLTYERLGSPEGELAFANAVIYLAVAAKSNAAYMAHNQVKALVAQDQTRPVPMHLRNAPTKMMKQMDYGKDYRYAHDEPEAYAAGEQYLPDGLTHLKFYQPTNRGLEGKIAEKLAQLAQLDAEAKAKKK